MIGLVSAQGQIMLSDLAGGFADNGFDHRFSGGGDRPAFAGNQIDFPRLGWHQGSGYQII